MGLWDQKAMHSHLVPAGTPAPRGHACPALVLGKLVPAQVRKRLGLPQRRTRIVLLLGWLFWLHLKGRVKRSGWELT